MSVHLSPEFLLLPPQERARRQKSSQVQHQPHLRHDLWYTQHEIINHRFLVTFDLC